MGKTRFVVWWFDITNWFLIQVSLIFLKNKFSRSFEFAFTRGTDAQKKLSNLTKLKFANKKLKLNERSYLALGSLEKLVFWSILENLSFPILLSWEEDLRERENLFYQNIRVSINSCDLNREKQCLFDNCALN